MGRIGKKDLFRVALRSFYIQGAWNFERMLALGICFCLLPIAQRLCRNQAERIEFLQRHLDFFNAHPYMASWALGAISRLEELAYLQEWPDRRPISIFKERLCGPLGVIGDLLFWNFWKPLTAMIGVIVALIFGVVAVPVFLILYNIPHLYVRFTGVFKGYRKGFDVVRDMSIRKYQSHLGLLLKIAGACSGIMIVVAGYWTLYQEHNSNIDLITFASCLLLSYIAAKRKLPVSIIMVAVVSIVILIGGILLIR